MPKIRGIKPDLWTDENFVELSAYARLLWVGLWNFACDNGHLQDKSKQIKMRVLPTDDVNCADLLREIEAQKLIERADGWITIPNLTHHQRPHKRWFVVCEKEGCAHPKGTSYGFVKPNLKPESTVEQPLNNGGAPVGQPVINGGSTADGDGDGDGDGDTSCAPARSSTDVEREFEQWYLAYPRKRGKGQAVKAYRAARKKTDALTLLVALQRQSAALMARGPEYVPYPATWLNGERWLDQPDVRAAPAEDPNAWMRRTLQ